VGVFGKLFGKKDLRNDPRCPLNVAEEKMRQLSGFLGGPAQTFGGFTKNPDHPVCRQCSRRNDPVCE